MYDGVASIVNWFDGNTQPRGAARAGCRMCDTGSGTRLLKHGVTTSNTETQGPAGNARPCCGSHAPCSQQHGCASSTLPRVWAGNMAKYPSGGCGSNACKMLK
jgi:hypothetical protein